MTGLNEIQMSNIIGGNVVSGFCIGFAAGALLFPAAAANPLGMIISFGCIGYGVYNLIVD